MQLKCSETILYENQKIVLAALLMPLSDPDFSLQKAQVISSTPHTIFSLSQIM